MATQDPLGRLWDDVLTARREVAASRSQPRGRPAASQARTELLMALEAYAECLEAHGRPIPYQLQRELSLARLTRGR